MKYKRIFLAGLSTLLMMSLSSCSLIQSFLDNMTKTTTATETTVYEDLGNYYKDLDPITSNCNYKLINNSVYVDAVPSTGDINLLVIPVEFSDYTFSYAGYETDSQLYDDLNRVYNGTEEETGYFKSVSEFYKESSYGKLNLSFEIAPKYEVGLTAKQFKSLTNSSIDSDTDRSTYILEEAVESYRSLYGDSKLKEFDNDNDGLIDGVMLIYSCPNSGNNTNFAREVGDTEQSLYWAYCYWDSNNCAELLYYAENGISGHKNKNQLKESPLPASYFWASYDFMYEYQTCQIGGNVDSHTFDHEFGHMLGLDDYYSYDDEKYRRDSYSRVGFADMMEGNIYDHNAYSKATLGWNTPYIVTGDCTITIKSSALYDECIILADSYDSNAFDEYLMLELFTPEGLNYYDSHYAYSSTYPICYTEAGVKIYHVDSRLCYSSSGGKGTYTYTTPNVNLKYAYKVAATNSVDRDAIQGNYDLINIINADKSLGNKTSTSINPFKDNSSFYGTNSHLFHNGDTFTMSDYESLFPNSTKLNNGNELNYKIEILSLSNESATIRFTQI